MTQAQESVSTRQLTSERAFTAPFIAIAAGLVVLLMALAVTSFALASRPSTAIEGHAATEAVDGWLPAATTAGSQHRLESAQQLRDGWARELVPQRTSTATDGWEAGLIQPHAPAVDGYIQRFLNDD